MTSRRITFATCVLMSCALNAHADSLISIPDDVRHSVQQRVDEGSASGMIIGLIDEGGTSYFAYGQADRATKRPIDENSIFEIGSASKAFTAILLADMASDGVVALDDPVEKYLPKSVKVPSKGDKKITLRHLACHRSSLPRMPDNFEPVDTTNPYADYGPDRLYAFLSSHTLTRDIGAEYEYSNLGAGLLGHALSLAAGKEYEALLQQRICNPIGMTDTSIALSDSKRKRLAKGHVGTEEVNNWDLNCLAGAGGIRSSAKDMLRFISANLGLVPSKLSEAMATTHAADYTTNDSTLRIGLGWHIWKKYGRHIVWHNGGTGGYHSFCGFDPQRKVGVVVLCNSSHNIDDIGLHILEPKFELTKTQRSVALDPKTIGEYVGYYKTQEAGVVLEITQEGSGLVLQTPMSPKLTMFAEAKDKFFLKEAEVTFTFERNDEGVITTMLVHSAAGTEHAIRQPEGFTPPHKRKAAEIDKTVLKDYVGSYSLTPEISFEVTLQNELLQVRITGQPPMPVYPESETKFFYKVVDAQITFVRDEAGVVTALILHQGGRDQTATKAK